VPAANTDNLWGVGFYNATSRDAFLALWLEHDAEAFDGLKHGGAPTLHYDGHGQLWSRYPAEHARLKAGTSIRQKNAYLVLPYEGPKAAPQIERLRHQLKNPLAVQPGELPPGAAATSSGALARDGETPQSAPLKPAIWKALAEVRDEQLYNIDGNIVDLGYVYDVRARDGVVTVLVSMPHRGRPVHDFLVTAGGGRVEPGIRERLLKLDKVREVVVSATWNPPWTIARATDAGRRALGLPA
jgi:metal-sulfur cluster biosynthetic enzyme